MPSIEKSIVIPLLNERGNLELLASELDAEFGQDPSVEVIWIDDGSSDGSLDLYPELGQRYRWLRWISHSCRQGQSAAFLTGIRASEGQTIGLMDGDLQNDPADLARLFSAYATAPGPAVIVGHRVNRQDTFVKRISSRIANSVRRAILRDGCNDTGCSLKVFDRQQYLRHPAFDHMHRFIPALFAQMGARVINVPVTDRPRHEGESKYGIGNRLMVGLVDLAGVWWLARRRLPTAMDGDQ